MLPHPIDVLVGRRLKERRLLLGLTQTAIAEAAGISFQQVQKYETGKNRIGASLLYEFSKTLRVSVDFFFEGAEPARDGPRRRPVDDAVFTGSETLELVRAFYRIKDRRSRHGIAKLVKSLGTG